jgi:hypothetical protein
MAYRVACLVLGVLGALAVFFGSRPVFDLPEPSEAEILKTALAILRANGVFAWRNNTAAWFPEGKDGRRRCIRCGLRGSCDILGVLPDGRFLGLEIKRKGERPRPDQVEFMRNINMSNGIAFWVDEIRHLEKVLPFILKGARMSADEDRIEILEVP